MRIVIVLVFLVAVCCFIAMRADDASTEMPQVGERAAEPVVLQALDMERIPSGGDLREFSLSSARSPEISDSSKEAIQNILAAFENEGDPVGFIFVNMESGKGIAANVDEVVYGASSIKGPFAAYVCEHLIESGELSLADELRSFDESFHSNGSVTVKTLLMGSIEDSSNGMFAGLRRAVEASDYDAWLLGLGVGPNIHVDGDLFAWYSARDAAKLWTEIYRYLDQETDMSKFLEEELNKTNFSFIREGISEYAGKVAEQEGETPFERLIVLNKAGWCATEYDSSVVSSSKADDVVIDGQPYRWLDETTKYDSVCDNGIVTIDGVDYLLCVMSGSRYSDSSVERIESLVAAIVETYPSLSEASA